MSTPQFKFNPFTHRLDYVGSGGSGPTTYYSLTPYIVGPDVNSQYSTISSAIAAAVGAGVSSSNPANIYIKPQNGGYTEDPVLVDGINLVGQSPQTVINGKVSMTTAGSATINGLTLQDNGDYSLQIGGSAGSFISVNNCNFNTVAHTQINIGPTANGLIHLKDCTALSAGVVGATIFTVQSGGLRILNCYLNGHPATASTADGSGLAIDNSGLSLTITASSAIEINNSTISGGTLTMNGAGGNNFVTNSYIVMPAGPIAITIGAGAIAYVSHCLIDSAAVNAITGAGTMNYAFLSFANSSGVSVATATPLATLI
jgi:hypothetical protein